MALRTMAKTGLFALAFVAIGAGAQEIQKRGKTSYLPVDQTEPFASRLLTLDDTVEFFNLVLETKLTEPEKKDLVAFLRTL